MGMFKADAPSPPDPIRTASGATATNVSTSIANAFLNNVNQITPEGKLNYDVTSQYQWTDPTSGTQYTIPNFTATQSLTPAQQNIQDNNIRADTNLSGLAANQSGMLQNLLGTPFNPTTGAPGSGDINWMGGDATNAQSSFGNVGGQQRSLGPYEQSQTTFGDGNDYSADRARVEEALYKRMDPQLQRDRGAMESRLADQGIKIGSPAYQSAMDQFDRQLNDARLGITQAGAAEQQQAYTQAKGRGEFANTARAQNFQNLLQSGTFANQAQTQDYQQAALRGQFANAAAAQNLARAQTHFNAQNQLRSQYLSEQAALRNQPINEITALLSGSQVKDPSWVQTGQNNIPTTDVAGLINNKFSQDMSSYQQQSANFNSLMGGIFGALGGLARSDRRVKENIDRVGTVFAAGPDGEKPLPVYEYEFKDDPTDKRHTGPMAQDVEKIDRKAVKNIKGTKYIDTTRLGSILRA